MVSLRCRIIVKQELLRLNIPFSTVDLGVVELARSISKKERSALKANLLLTGLELLDDRKSILIERIKGAIIRLIHEEPELPPMKYSTWLSEKLKYDYTYLANIFSEVKGVTIQQYIILHKIEKVKELLLYDELNLTEISRKLHYSSVAHLSTQFKKATGLTPSFFKRLKHKRMKNLEDI